MTPIDFTTDAELAAELRRLAAAADQLIADDKALRASPSAKQLGSYAAIDETIGLALHTELHEAMDAHIAAFGRLHTWVTGRDAK